MSDILISGNAIQSLMAESAIKIFKGTLEGYQSPLEPIITDAFKLNSEAIRRSVYAATSDCVNDPNFTKQLKDALNHKLANLIINKRSGLVEKSFNELMNDVVLRNKLQSAVIEIVSKAKAGAA